MMATTTIKNGDTVIFTRERADYLTYSPVDNKSRLKKGDKVVVLEVLFNKELPVIVYKCPGHSVSRNGKKYPDAATLRLADVKLFDPNEGQVDQHKCTCPKPILFAQGCQCGGF
jgi:hypothetical protein